MREFPHTYEVRFKVWGQLYERDHYNGEGISKLLEPNSHTNRSLITSSLEFKVLGGI
jgi:hypothetical protein